MVDISKYQTENLLVLIGSNPLPNYVAIKLLAHPETKVFFLYTDEVIRVAERLRLKLISEGISNISMVHVQSTEGFLIQEALTKIINNDLYSTWGLHYTGGTKVMAVHSFQTVYSLRKEAVFSYLDAQTLELVVEIPDHKSLRFLVRHAVNPSLTDLIDLHQYKVISSGSEKPLLPDQAILMSKIFCEELTSIRGDEFKRKFNQINFGMGDQLPMDPPFDVMKPLWGNSQTFDELAFNWGMKNEPGKFTNWLLGGIWLEHFVMTTVLNISQDCNLRAISQNFRAKPDIEGATEFQLDVIAMKGYQLYVISCGMSDDKGILKLKLFEAYTRAKQLGGDEARVALVCGARPYHPKSNRFSSPQIIQNEVRHDWNPQTPIRVFGLEHFARLDEYLKEWFMTS